MHGCLSYFTVCTLMQHKIDYCLTLLATAENIEWNPYSEELSQLEFEVLYILLIADIQLGM